METERKLSVPLGELVEYIRKTYAAKAPAECKICVDGVKYDVTSKVEVCWMVNEPVPARNA